jgi:hypothetical protein
MSGHQNDFRKWIEAGFKDYGKDPWFFIRELAQNSRDAGADAIHVRIGYTAQKEEALVFEDNGRGMTYDDAGKFLFRLYASSKTDEKYAAGMFGIGFWTVLKFEPSTVIIESCTGGTGKREQWGVQVEVGQDLITKTIRGGLTGRGTRITLVRPAREKSERAFFKKTRNALERYCSYLRCGHRSADPLPVYFGGENITRPMTLPGPVSMYFKDGDVEGAVGLAPQPQVRLYARGLPVWQGTTLEELSHTPPQQSSERDFGQGLAPVFLLNGNQLEVNISRRKVIDNRHLRQVRKTAEKALIRMVENAADSVSPRTWIHRVSDRFKGHTTSIFRSFGKTFLLLLLVLAPLEIFLLKTFYKPSPSGSTGGTQTPVTGLLIRADRPIYTGASVRTGYTAADPGFVYSPATDKWFKIFYADSYRTGSGFVQTPGASSGGMSSVPPPQLNCRGEPIAVQFNITRTWPVFLPQPVGYLIDPGSVTLQGVAVETGSVIYRDTGEVVLNPDRTGAVHYRCCSLDGEDRGRLPLLSPLQLRDFTQLPRELKLPPGVLSKLDRANHLPLVQKVNTAVSLTSSLLHYDASPRTARKYAGFSGSSNNANWFGQVTAIGAGDCDVINGLTVLFLRKLGVPARLVIGVVGKRGEILPLLHAWTEYFDPDGKRWIIDASTHTPRLNTGEPTDSGDPRYPRPYTARKTKASPKPMFSRSFLLFMLAAIGVILIVLIFLLASRKAKKSPPLSPRMRRRVEQDLAGMALHALLHPNQFHNSSIRDLKLIPTLNRGPVSIRDALKLGREQKLFTAAEDDPIINFLDSSSRSVPVPLLDAGNHAFAPLIKLLPGAVHLQQVTALKALDPGKAENNWLGQLLAEANRFLKEIPVPAIPTCWLAGGHMSEDFLDVDLSPLPRLPLWLIPNRCIVVNPYSRRINALAAMYQKNPPLALFRFIDLLLKSSKLVPIPTEPILETVSRRLLHRRTEVKQP